ncbi:hypothetical protein HAX54_017890 [Datura stramonium]|uniref:Uncharacterized protein n=1 Tax=Datura stramonium TaxID=4076 RepID=A0ABS8UN10_DATST|nr:hypothetical protein [Datura stramonium]
MTPAKRRPNAGRHCFEVEGILVKCRSVPAKCRCQRRTMKGLSGLERQSELRLADRHLGFTMYGVREKAERGNARVSYRVSERPKLETGHKERYIAHPTPAQGVECCASTLARWRVRRRPPASPSPI